MCVYIYTTVGKEHEIHVECSFVDPLGFLPQDIYEVLKFWLLNNRVRMSVLCMKVCVHLYA